MGLYFHFLVSLNFNKSGRRAFVLNFKHMRLVVMLVELALVPQSNFVGIYVLNLGDWNVESLPVGSIEDRAWLRLKRRWSCGCDFKAQVEGLSGLGLKLKSKPNINLPHMLMRIRTDF